MSKLAKKIFLVLISAECIFGYPISTSAACKVDHSRSVIYLRNYTYTDVPKFHAAFSQFRIVFKDNTERLSFELIRKNESASFNELSFEPNNHRTPPPEYKFKNIGDALSWWKNSGNDALGVMHGFIESDEKVEVKSLIFLGDLRSKNYHPTVRTGTELGLQQLVDGHSLVTAYALALDAQRRACDARTVYTILASANQLAKQLEQYDQLDGDLLAIANEVEKLLESIRAK